MSSAFVIRVLKELVDLKGSSKSTSRIFFRFEIAEAAYWLKTTQYLIEKR